MSKQFQITSPCFPSVTCNRLAVAVLLFQCFKTAELRSWFGDELTALYVKVDGIPVLTYIPEERR